MEQLEINPLLYPECLLSEWRKHFLRPVWRDMYPGLFFAEELQHTKQERYGYGFGDWFTSIHLHFRFPDCIVLRRSYFREKDPMFLRASKILGEQGTEFIRTLKNRSGTNPPDLLVLPARGKFFFVEVKRDQDIIRPNQRFAFTKIERKLGCTVMIASLRRVKETEDSSMPEECKKAFEKCNRRMKRRNTRQRRG